MHILRTKMRPRRFGSEAGTRSGLGWFIIGYDVLKQLEEYCRGVRGIFLEIHGPALGRRCLGWLRQEELGVRSLRRLSPSTCTVWSDAV